MKGNGAAGGEQPSAADTYSSAVSLTNQIEPSRSNWLLFKTVFF